jgi:TonB-dependent receptor
MVKNSRQRWQLAAKGGVSLLALIGSGISMPAFGQASADLSTPDAAQEQTANEDQNDAIVVTGRRAALERAEERKRNSETVMDSVVADDAGKLPDNSITEVLQRVSGVTIVRFAALGDPDHYSVEGAGIQVRGLTGVASRLNGREIFSANNGRSLQFADVTPELMQAVDVYKGSTADLLVGGTGGQIDLRTKLPFDYKGGFHVAATGELSMGDLARKADPSGSVLVTQRWSTGIGDIGFLADVAYSRLSSTSHFFRVEPYKKTRIAGTDYYIPGGYTYGEEQFERTRTGIYGAVQWAPSPDLTLTGIFFQSRYKNRSGDWGSFVASDTLAVNPANSEFDANNVLLSSPSFYSRDTGTFLPAGSITSGGNKGAYRSRTTTKDYSFTLNWAPGDSPLSVKGALQRVDSTQAFNRLDIFRDTQFQSGFGMDMRGDLPVVTVPAGTQEYLNDPAHYFWTATMPHDEDNKGRLDSANLDLEYKFDDSFFRSVKVGGRIADRTERDLANGYDWQPLGRGWNGDPQLTYANAAPGDVELHVFKNFFHGQAALPANVMFATDALAREFDRRLLHSSPPANFCAGREFDCSVSGPLSSSTYGNRNIRQPGFVLPNDQNNGRTQTKEAYALVRFGSPDPGISGNVGARFINIQNDSTGYIQQNANTFVRNGQTQSLGTQVIARSGRATYNYVLPSINLDYAPSEDIKIRAGYNITLDLPTFFNLRANGSIGVATSSNPIAGQPGIFTNFTADTGDPFLKPTISNNFDISLEWYARPGTSFHLAPFYKHIKNSPTRALTTRPITVIFANGTSEDVQAAATDTATSTEAATVKGFEVGGRMFFDMLPGVLSGFGFEGNYTLVDSKNPGDRYIDINGRVANDVPLVGLSRHNFNATLLYERKAISARIAYSWRSKYLTTVNGNGTSPAYPYYSAPGVLTNLADGSASNTQVSLPVYGGNYGQLEAGIRFKVTENFSWGVQGTNLTNSTQHTLQGGYPGGKLYGRSWFQSDRRISTGINLAF